MCELKYIRSFITVLFNLTNEWRYVRILYKNMNTTSFVQCKLCFFIFNLSLRSGRDIHITTPCHVDNNNYVTITKWNIVTLVFAGGLCSRCLSRLVCLHHKVINYMYIFVLNHKVISNISLYIYVCYSIDILYFFNL